MVVEAREAGKLEVVKKGSAKMEVVKWVAKVKTKAGLLASKWSSKYLMEALRDCRDILVVVLVV